MSEQENRYGDR